MPAHEYPAACVSRTASVRSCSRSEYGRPAVAERKNSVSIGQKPTHQVSAFSIFQGKKNSHARPENRESAVVALQNMAWFPRTTPKARPTEGATSMTFWKRLCTEQSRSYRCTVLSPSERICTSTCARENVHTSRGGARDRRKRGRERARGGASPRSARQTQRRCRSYVYVCEALRFIEERLSFETLGGRAEREKKSYPRIHSKLMFAGAPRADSASPCARARPSLSSFALRTTRMPRPPPP